ncbi:hypothetical protein IDJ77_06155 [Mucilaginibacter sp. ZT4R22]|uniref:Uncharacterized protein n=1 Tax=Mucilaginibacter pankratovii TaxID=2772110 RepID=A0ABR7WM50_9SPHI|nr:hypothetical protein [Mucilaginibacter pankratovii]MBD1363387.1 hypothetical protein [Mucilaginibacter pankratovii]
MHKRIISLLCFLLFSGLVHGQEADSITLSRIKFGDTETQVKRAIIELKQQTVDTIVFYYLNCLGGVQAIKLDSCNSSQTKYIIWKHDNKSYIRQFDGCNISEARVIPPAFLNTVLNNLKRIKNEKILYPQYTRIYNGKKTELTVYIDHSCHTIFEIQVPSAQFEVSIDDFATDTKLIDGKFFNKNHYKNRQTVLFRLQGIIEKVVHQNYPTKKPLK